MRSRLEHRALDWPQAPAEAPSHLGYPNPAQHDHRIREFAMFNLAIDSKSRVRDLVLLRITDICSAERQDREPRSSSRRRADQCPSN